MSFASYGTFTAGRVVTGEVVSNVVNSSNIFAGTAMAAPTISGQQVSATIAMAAPEIASNIFSVENYNMTVSDGIFKIDNLSNTATFTVEPY